MILDLNSPESIRQWVGIAPERHRAQLRAMWAMWPRFREPIELAMKEPA